MSTADMDLLQNENTSASNSQATLFDNYCSTMPPLGQPGVASSDQECLELDNVFLGELHGCASTPAQVSSLAIEPASTVCLSRCHSVLPSVDTGTDRAIGYPTLLSTACSGRDLVVPNMTEFEPSIEDGLELLPMFSPVHPTGWPRETRRHWELFPHPNLRQGLTDNSTALMDFYFGRLAPLFCCYGDSCNPFRTEVGRLWTLSGAKALALAIQSMSMACLADLTPRLHPSASRLRRQALTALRDELQTDMFNTPFVYALILLGASSGWFKPKDSMEGIFQQYKLKMDNFYGDPLNYVGGPNTLDTAQMQLFVGLLVYWDMYLSFMSTETSSQDSSHLLYGIFQTESSQNSQPLNPWTGISTEIIVLTTLVGKLVRRVRGRQYQRFALDMEDLVEDVLELERAYDLQRRLLSVSTKADAPTYTAGLRDEDASVKELTQLGEAYRLTALLQLYRVFPQLDANNVAQLPIISQRDSVTTARSAEKLENMAMSIVEVILKIPISSKSLRFQLVPLVAAACELSAGSPHADFDAAALSDSLAVIRIAKLRLNVRNRFEAMHEVFPGNRMQNVLKLVKEMWHRLDNNAGDERAYWVDVAIENDWRIT